MTAAVEVVAGVAESLARAGALADGGRAVLLVPGEGTTAGDVEVPPWVDVAVVVSGPGGGAEPRLVGTDTGPARPTGPATGEPAALGLSGACSPVAVDRVRRAVGAVASSWVDPLDADGGDPVPALVGWLSGAVGAGPALVFTTAPPELVARGRAELDPDRLAEATTGVLARLAKAAAERGTTRFAVAGGASTLGVLAHLGMARLAVGSPGPGGGRWLVDLDRPERSVLALVGDDGDADALTAALGVAPADDAPAPHPVEPAAPRATGATGPARAAGTSDLTAARLAVVAAGRRAVDTGLAPSATGTLAAVAGRMVVLSPPSGRLDALDPTELTVLDLAGTHRDGPRPALDAALVHAALAARPDGRAAALLHPTAGVALSARADVDPTDVLPPLTLAGVALGPVALVPPPVPGDEDTVAEAVGALAARHPLLLVAHHGALAVGPDLPGVVATLVELEAAAAVVGALGDARRRHLTPEQVRRVRSGQPHPPQERRGR